MYTGVFEGAEAWTEATFDPAHWRVTLPAECRAEIGAALAQYRNNPLPTVLLDPADFALPACVALMRRVRRQLEDGSRFALLDRLPVEDMTPEEAKAIYWLLCSLLARPVAQKLIDGTMIYDVLDTGVVATAGSGIRPDKTNIEIVPHNDNSYNPTPPNFVGLLCLRAARSGGLSRVVSFHALHNRLRARSQNALARLYEPFWFDRQREHLPDEPPIHAAPVFAYEQGRLLTRLALFQMKNGTVLRGEPLDEAGRVAVAAVEAALAEPDLCASFTMVPGQIQLLNNLAVGHSRTAFVDHDAPEQRRHVVRIWMRDHGHRGYRG
jgi:alpha-ketoglutarate-dependent taurine dioxygenase